MTTPEQAVRSARQAAASMREQGAYQGDTARHESPTADALDERKLWRWALIDPDISDVRSTRRFGAPITALKRTLVRLLDQYHQELIAEQTRFNVAVLERLTHLERRIAALEEERKR